MSPAQGRGPADPLLLLCLHMTQFVRQVRNILEVIILFVIFVFFFDFTDNLFCFFLFNHSLYLPTSLGIFNIILLRVFINFSPTWSENFFVLESLHSGGGCHRHWYHDMINVIAGLSLLLVRGQSVPDPPDIPVSDSLDVKVTDHRTSNH